MITGTTSWGVMLLTLVGGTENRKQVLQMLEQHLPVFRQSNPAIVSGFVDDSTSRKSTVYQKVNGLLMNLSKKLSLLLRCHKGAQSSNVPAQRPAPVTTALQLRRNRGVRCSR